MDRKIGAGLKRGFEMTPEQRRQRRQEKLPTQSFEGLSEEDALRFQDAMNRIQSKQFQKSPEEQYVEQMRGSEVQEAFDSALSPEDLIKLKALHKMRMGR